MGASVHTCICACACMQAKEEFFSSGAATATAEKVSDMLKVRI